MERMRVKPPAMPNPRRILVPARDPFHSDLGRSVPQVPAKRHVTSVRGEDSVWEGNREL